MSKLARVVVLGHRPYVFAADREAWTERRSVPVPVFLRDDLALACADKGPDDFLFPSATGRVVRVSKFRKAGFDDAVKAAGLGGFKPQHLRDAAMLGHSSATMTLDRYAALWPDELDAVADRIDAARIAESSRTTRGPIVVPLRATEA